MNNNSTFQSATSGWTPAGIARDLAVAWRLLWDPRVPSMLKILLPMLAFLYWLSPIDLLPGMPFDDIALMIVALRLFVQLAPSDAVNHAFTGRSKYSEKGGQPNYRTDDDANTVDTTWRVIDE